MSHESQFVFLSRPRRFGKSLLCSTLKYYFQGRKDLFEGLSIGELEKEWKQYPVLHFDISACKNKYENSLIIEELHSQLDYHEEKYGMTKTEGSPGTRFKKLIQGLHKEIGLKTVVIIDEYDAPLLDYLHKPDELEQVRRIMQEFYQMVKVCDADEQFVFITGITKFSQLSIFSTLNNLTNISMAGEYTALCGITKDEMLTVFDPDIQTLADLYHCSKEEMIDMLKQQYDGYHFGKDSQDIFNPYSLVNAFKMKDLDYYWFGSGTPTFLFESMKRFNTNLLELEQLNVPSSQFDVPTEAMTSALPLLYQAGYLTIKGYDFYSRNYTLEFPLLDDGHLQRQHTGLCRQFLRQFDSPRHRRRPETDAGLLRLHPLPRLRGKGIGRHRQIRGLRCGLCDGTEDARHGARGPRPNQLEGLRDSLPSRRQACHQDRYRFFARDQDGFGLDN